MHTVVGITKKPSKLGPLNICSFDKNSPLTKEDVIIVLGDFGANYFFNYRDKIFKEKLKEYKATFFIIRGNHEERPSICRSLNPPGWKKEQFFENDVWVETNFPYIKYAMDYPCIYKIHGHKTLIIPGAYSVDKFYRLANHWGWFEDEQLSTEEQNIGRKIVEEQKECDIILSHTCPTIFEPTDLFLSTVDQSLVDRTMERYLTEIESKLDYKLYMWGHFHKFREYPREEGVPTIENPRQLMIFKEFVELEEALQYTTFFKL